MQVSLFNSFIEDTSFDLLFDGSSSSGNQSLNVEIDADTQLEPRSRSVSHPVISYKVTALSIKTTQDEQSAKVIYCFNRVTFRITRGISSVGRARA
jgi:hypothetical protein